MRLLPRTRLLPLYLAGICLGTLATPARVEANQRIRFQVADDADAMLTDLRVEMVRLGEVRVVRLVDDGSVDGDMPWDGVYVGEDAGDYARYVDVRLIARESGGPDQVLVAAVVNTDDENLVDLGWRIVRPPDASLKARRAAVAWPGFRMAAVEGLHLIAAFGWGFLVIAYVGMAVRARRT